MADPALSDGRNPRASGGGGVCLQLEAWRVSACPRCGMWLPLGTWSVRAPSMPCGSALALLRPVRTFPEGILEHTHNASMVVSGPFGSFLHFHLFALCDYILRVLIRRSSAGPEDHSRQLPFPQEQK